MQWKLGNYQELLILAFDGKRFKNEEVSELGLELGS